VLREIRIGQRANLSALEVENVDVFLLLRLFLPPDDDRARLGVRNVAVNAGELPRGQALLWLAIESVLP